MASSKPFLILAALAETLQNDNVQKMLKRFRDMSSVNFIKSLHENYSGLFSLRKDSQFCLKLQPATNQNYKHRHIPETDSI